ncbi:ArsR/SmtB family transcription factor [Salinimicrobium flavum]|uniref:ArsR/SmtB family transcription factor n=1 Tax=Salinimicrobium flavum TaxID=1737065 RepID=A0ABW5IW61_9FLAO
MGVTKTDLFTDSQNDMALAAKALAHPARVAIIEFLLKSDSCINGDLVNELGLAQATISQHLRELKDIGIIQGTIEGTRVSYCINAKRWSEIQEKFNKIFNQFRDPSSKDCC